MDEDRIKFVLGINRPCYMIVKIMATLKKEAFIQENKRLFVQERIPLHSFLPVNNSLYTCFPILRSLGSQLLKKSI